MRCESAFRRLDPTGNPLEEPAANARRADLGAVVVTIASWIVGTVRMVRGSMEFEASVFEEEFVPFDDRIHLCFLPDELVFERRCSGFEEGDFCSDR